MTDTVTDVKTEDTTVVEPEVKTEKIELTKQEYDVLIADQKEMNTLKAHHDKIAQDKKDSLAKAAKDKAESEGNYKELLELKEREYQESLTSKDTEISKYVTEKRQNAVDKVANDIASDLATDSKRAKALAKFLKDRLQYTEDGVKVTDGKGNLVSDKFDSLIEWSKKEYDFLCDGIQSQGGAGDKIVKPTGTDKQQASEAEQLALYKSNPSKWRDLYGK